MVTQYFTTDVITAEEYVGYVRTIFQLQSSIDMVGLDGVRYYTKDVSNYKPLVSIVDK